MSGKVRRLQRLFPAGDCRGVLAPLDDSLLAGPENGLRNIRNTAKEIANGTPNGIIAFCGLLSRCEDVLVSVPTIANITASSTVGIHTRKIQVAALEDAVALGADAVAVHVNISSSHEPEMLGILGRVGRDCYRLGIPLLAMMYPRREVDGRDDNYEELRRDNLGEYSRLVRHAVRIGVELGADLIKTQYTGSVESFASVVDSACGVPVFTAGGPLLPAQSAMQNAFDAVVGGASGVSFGRNVFNRSDPASMITALKMIVLDRLSPAQVCDSVGFIR